MANIDLFPEINENRVITLTSSRGDWKQNISSLLAGQKSRKTGQIYTMFNPLDDWNVDPEVKLLMTENKPIKIANSPDAPLSGLKKGFSGSGGIVSKLGSLFTAGASLLSAWNAAGDGNNTSGLFNPWISELTTWKGGQVLDLTLSLDFSMGQYGLWSAKKEVINPIMNLLAPVLPQYMNSWMQYGAFPNTFQFVAGLIKGIFNNVIDKDSQESDFVNNYYQKNGSLNGIGNENTEFQDIDPTYTSDQSVRESNALNNHGINLNNIESNNSALSSKELSDLAEKLETYVLNEYTNFTYDIKFGNTFTFYKMLPISANTKFSNEVDQDGYPISGNIELTFRGIMPLTLASSTDAERSVRFGTKGWITGTGENEQKDIIGDRSYY